MERRSCAGLLAYGRHVVSSAVLGDHPSVVLEELAAQGVVPAVVLQLGIVHQSCAPNTSCPHAVMTAVTVYLWVYSALAVRQ